MQMESLGMKGTLDTIGVCISASFHIFLRTSPDHFTMQILVPEEIVGYRVSQVMAMLLTHRPQFE